MVAGEGVGLTIDQVLALQKAHPDQFHYEFKPSLTYEHIDLKKENPFLQDVRVRRALLMAMDRQTMVDRLFQGKQPVAATWVNPLSPNYDADVPVVKFDPAGAKALLKEAGWTPGADGICRNAAGEKLEFEFGTTAGNRLRELQEQVLQSNWKNACVAGHDQERARAHLVRRHAEAAQLHRHGDVWPGAATSPRSPLRTLASDPDPDRGQQLRRRELSRLQRPEDGRRHRRRRRRARPGEAEGDLGGHADASTPSRCPCCRCSSAPRRTSRRLWLRGYEPTGQGDMSCYWAENWHPG